MKAELSEAIRKEEEVVRYIRNVLSPDELGDLERHVSKELRSPALAGLLWILFGLHLAYLRDYRGQAIFLITLGGFGIWWLLEGWVLESRIKLFNLRLYQQYASEILSRRRKGEADSFSAQTIVIRRNKQELT
jgi:hypothetical protein